MKEQTDFPLPPDLPRPVDDHAGDHLRDMPLPQVSLRSTNNKIVSLPQSGTSRTVIYCYPMTGVPGNPLPTRMGSNPWSAWMYAAIMQLPGSLQGTLRTQGRRLWIEHSNDCISTRDGQASTPTIRNPERHGIQIMRRAAPAYIRDRRNAACEAPDVNNPRWENRACLLSRFPS
jgi:hypothetical protein